MDNSLYTGISKDPEKRYWEHLKGKGGAYTRSHKPIKIVYKEKCGSKSAALKREFLIKSWTKSKKEALINDYRNTPTLIKPISINKTVV